MDDREWEALYQLLSRLEARWLAGVDQSSDEKSHAYDPLPVRQFIEGLRDVASLTTGRRLLDVGCGIGTKLALAHYMGWTVSGIERWAPYVDVARELVPEASVTVGDAFDMKRFDADVVYAYRPMRAAADELTLERHLLDGMTHGSLLWLPERNPIGDLMARQLTPGVWKTV